jgi:type II secretory pathway pseudopilin PulG
MSKKLRPAITMIELIFALVIMGIVLMSAPTLISMASKSGYVAMQQEAINEAASQANIVMGYHWDENNTDEMYLDPILQVSSGDSNLNEIGTTGRRLGTPQESYRTFVRSDGQRFNASTLGNDAGDTEKDDIDDFSGDSYLREVESASSDYIESDTIQINTSVSYIFDTPGGGSYADPGADKKITFNPNFTSTPPGTTNIKKITVTLTNPGGIDELDKTIVFNAFSCNIGAYELEERNF